MLKGLGGTVGAASLAGCTGGDGGAGGNTGSGGGDLEEVSMVYPPWAGNLVLDHIRNQTSILEDELSEAGYTLSVTMSWNDTTLFAGGKADFMPTMADIEAAVFGVEREIDITLHGLGSPNYEGLYVRRGSEVDPANTGSVEASIQKMIDEQRRFGHAGYEQGAVWPMALVMQERFGVQYEPGNSDFKLAQADWFTLPQLLVDGEVDMIVNAPILGTDAFLTSEHQPEPPIKDILWFQPEMEDAGVPAHNLNLGMFGTSQEFSDQHEDFIAAFLRAWKRGGEWIANPDVYSDILANEENWKLLTAETKEEARIDLEFAWQNAHSENLDPLTYTDIELTEDRIQSTTDTLDTMAEMGLVGSNWSDFVEFKQVPIDG